MHLMVTRPRNTATPPRRMKATNSVNGVQYGRMLCCLDGVPSPADCFSDIADVVECDVLVEKVSGTTVMEEGTYTFWCVYSKNGYCNFLWVSPDGTDVFMLQFFGVSAWRAFAAYSGTTQSCEGYTGTTLGAFGTSEGTPNNDWWCNEIAMTLPTGGTPIAVYHFTLVHPP